MPAISHRQPSAATLVLWVSAAWLSYQDTRRKIEKVLDAHLVQTAASPLTLATLSVCSDPWSRVFCRFPPAEFHSLPWDPDAAPGSNSAPLSAAASAAIANDTSSCPPAVSDTLCLW